GRVVDDVEGRAHVGVRPPEGSEVPQRRASDGRGREVLVRALQGWRGGALSRPRARGAGGGSGPGAIRAEGAVARLHDVLRNERLGRRLGGAEEIPGEGR